MSHRFSVDPGALRSAARDAGTVAEAASRGDLVAAAGVGDLLVERAAARVVERWSSGLDHLHAELVEISSRLKKTADLYEDADGHGKMAADDVVRGLPRR